MDKQAANRQGRARMKKPLKVLAVGGGSGGHVTPVVAVIAELREQQSDVDIRFWCDRHFAPQAKSILADFDASLPVYTVWAGKLRRYTHLTILQHFTIPSVLFPNIRDVFLVFVGIIQSIVRLIMWRPDVVFSKGGYVCLPVGWAAWLLRIPLVIHDSDAHPGLTNRLLAPAAKRIGTGVPLENYNYPVSKAVYVGVPISSKYVPLDEQKKREVKKLLGFDPARPLLVCVGGGLGSKKLNDAIARQLPLLLEGTNVVLVSGAAQYDELRSLTPQNDGRFILKDFISQGMPELLGAADVVISRAGATFLLELAALSVPTILVPGKQMVWQVKHAKVFADAQAVLMLDEARFEDAEDQSIALAVRKVLQDDQLRHRLARNLHKQARPHAARDMAAMILRAVRKQR